MFKRLTDPLSMRRDVRRDALVSDIAAVAGTDAAEVIAVADVFRASGRHMLMPPPATPLDAQSRLDISHESLIRQWITLNEWAREESVNAREFQRLREKAQEELEGQADLLAGRDLTRALDWRKQAEPTPAWAARYGAPGQLETTLAFITRSAAEAQRRKDEQMRLVTRRARVYRGLTATALVLATFVAVSILSLWRKAEAERGTAVRQTDIAISRARARGQGGTVRADQGWRSRRGSRACEDQGWRSREGGKARERKGRRSRRPPPGSGRGAHARACAAAHSQRTRRGPERAGAGDPARQRRRKHTGERSAGARCAPDRACRARAEHRVGVYCREVAVLRPGDQKPMARLLAERSERVVSGADRRDPLGQRGDHLVVGVAAAQAAFAKEVQSAATKASSARRDSVPMASWSRPAVRTDSVAYGTPRLAS